MYAWLLIYFAVVDCEKCCIYYVNRAKVDEKK